jgi:hypothetical protein
VLHTPRALSRCSSACCSDRDCHQASVVAVPVPRTCFMIASWLVTSASSWCRCSSGSGGHTRYAFGKLLSQSPQHLICCAADEQRTHIYTSCATVLCAQPDKHGSGW